MIYIIIKVKLGVCVCFFTSLRNERWLVLRSTYMSHPYVHAYQIISDQLSNIC